MVTSTSSTRSGLVRRNRGQSNYKSLIEPMKLTFDFDIEDWNSFQRYHYSVSPTYRRLRTYIRLLFPAVALLMIVLRYRQHGLDPTHLGIFTVVATIWFLFYPRWMDRRVIRRSNQFLKEGRNDGLFGPREMELFPDRIHTTTSSGEATYRSNALKKIVETPDALLFYVSSIQALVIPKRKVSSDAFQQAVDFAQAHYLPQAES